MQEDMLKLNDWLYNNELEINVRKTKYMLFNVQRSTTFNLPPILINRTEMERTVEIRYLGLIIDENLHFSGHINRARNLIAPIVITLRQTKYLIPQQTKISIYYAYVHSRLQYLISIWGYSATSRLRTLQVIQNRAVRNIFWNEYAQDDIDTEALFAMHKILNVTQLIRYESLMTIFKIKNNLLKTGILFERFSDIHNYNTRNRENFRLPTVRTSLMNNSLTSRGLSWYNSLPQDLRTCTQLRQFKYLLKDHILNNT